MHTNRHNDVEYFINWTRTPAWTNNKDNKSKRFIEVDSEENLNCRIWKIRNNLFKKQQIKSEIPTQSSQIKCNFTMCLRN